MASSKDEATADQKEAEMETFAKRKNKLETWEETKIKPQYGSLNMFITVKDLKNKRTELFGKIVSLETDGTILILKYKKIEALFTVFRCDFNSDLALDSCIGTVAISLL